MFLARVPEALALVDELNLTDRLTAPAAGGAAIWLDGAAHPMPGGLVLGVPTDPAALRGSPLVEAADVEQVRAERPADWERMAAGQLPASVDAGAFGSRVRAALTDIVNTAGASDTVAVFSHGGVINVILHGILGTARTLSFPIDYASLTQLRYSREGRTTVASVNVVEHVWDLLPRNRVR